MSQEREEQARGPRKSLGELKPNGNEKPASLPVWAGGAEQSQARCCKVKLR